MKRKKVRKLLAGILSFIMIVVMMSGGLRPAEAYAEEAGKLQIIQIGDVDFYQITSAEDLKWFAEKVNGGDTSINGKLMDDIDLSLVCHAETGKNKGDAVNWTPIGNSDKQYRGTFDGNGKKISGLYINDTSADYQGLFGYVDKSGSIKNLGVEGSVQGKNYVGGVTGYNVGTVSNSYNTGKVKSAEAYAGGIAGYNVGIVSNSYNKGDVKGSNGINSNWYYYYGGVAGYNVGTVSDSYNTGIVSGGTAYVGGVVGYNDNNGTVSNSYNKGGVYGRSGVSGEIGGVAGKNAGTVSNSYNTGSVSGNYSVGGVAGKNARTVSNSYNTGIVSGESSVGGVVGTNSTGTVSNSYYLEGIKDVGSISGGEVEVASKTADEFKSGEVAYLLNGGKNIPDDQTVTWYQKLGTDDSDASPVLTSTGDNKVYYGYASLTDMNDTTKTYRNEMVHEVKITCPEDSHMTCPEESGNGQQRVIEKLSSITYKADKGYYFPEDYVTGIDGIQNGVINGVSITRESAAKIVISGTPTAEETEITLKATTKKGQQTMSDVTGVDETLCSKHDGKITNTTTAMEYRLKEAVAWTTCTGSEITGLAPGIYEVRMSETDTLLASDAKEITIKKRTHNFIPIFTWNGYTATAKIACEGCKIEKDNAEKVDVTVTSEITKEPTYDTEGEKTYTATAMYNGKTYTDTKTEVLPKKVRPSSGSGSGSGYASNTPTSTTVPTAAPTVTPSETPAATPTAVPSEAPNSTPKPTVTPQPTPSSTPKPTATPTKTPDKGTTVTDKNGTDYKVVSNGKTPTVAYKEPAKDAKGTVSIPSTTKVNGVTYKVTEIAQNAFKNETTITKIEIGDNVKKIDDGAFSGCTNLKTVSLGKNVTTLGDKAFANCKSLTKVTIPSKVKIIGDKAFANCKSLTAITIPASVTKIGEKAFSVCAKLKTITIKSTKLTTKNTDKKAFTGISKNTVVKVPASKYKEYGTLLRKKGLNKKVKVVKIKTIKKSK